MDEFEIIKHYFKKKPQSDFTKLGSGDDAAVIACPPEQELLLTTDTLVSGRHFLANTPAEYIAYKALAVNLSDLAAMGATPRWVLTALTLPEQNTQWLEQFAQNFFTLADEFKVDLIGGDLTKGPLSICVQAVGTVAAGKALKRSAAQVGDKIYVSGLLGEAAFGLYCLENNINDKACAPAIARHYKPKPQVALGQALLDKAHACIDISDGLLADLNHILQASQCGARIDLKNIPIVDYCAQHLSLEQSLAFALSGGDDYQLCFTMPADCECDFPIEVTCIGEITDSGILELVQNDGTIQEVKDPKGFKHF